MLHVNFTDGQWRPGWVCYRTFVRDSRGPGEVFYRPSDLRLHWVFSRHFCYVLCIPQVVLQWQLSTIRTRKSWRLQKTSMSLSLLSTFSRHLSNMKWVKTPVRSLRHPEEEQWHIIFISNEHIVYPSKRINPQSLVKSSLPIRVPVRHSSRITANLNLT